jgi:hypothetical protein
MKRKVRPQPDHKVSHHKRPRLKITDRQKLQPQPKNKSSKFLCLDRIALNSNCPQTVRYAGPHLRWVLAWRHMPQISARLQTDRSSVTFWIGGPPKGRAVTVGLFIALHFLKQCCSSFRVLRFRHFVLLVRAECRLRWWYYRETKVLGVETALPVSLCPPYVSRGLPGIDPTYPWWQTGDRPS